MSYKASTITLNELPLTRNAEMMAPDRLRCGVAKFTHKCTHRDVTIHFRTWVPYLTYCSRHPARPVKNFWCKTFRPPCIADLNCDLTFLKKPIERSHCDWNALAHITKTSLLWLNYYSQWFLNTNSIEPRVWFAMAHSAIATGSQLAFDLWDLRQPTSNLFRCREMKNALIIQTDWFPSALKYII